MSDSKKVSVKEVIEHLVDTDGTGDEDWVQELADSVSELGEVWWLGEIKISEIQNDNTSTKRDLLEGYADGIGSAPPVVLVPSDLPKFKYFVTDGAHRTATKKILKFKTVLAYYPELKSNPNFYETETHDDWGRDEYFARLEDAMRSSVKRILDKSADFSIVRLARKDGMQLIVHQTSQSGKNNWQVSWLDKHDVPEMHTLFKKREDALKSIAGAGGGESIGVPGEWKVVEKRNVR